MNTLKAEKRSMAIKAKRLRREGYVTGNVFGKEIEGSVPVKIGKQEAERFFKTAGKGSQIMLDVEGKLYDVLVKEVNYDSMRNEYQEIDFQALVSGEMVHSVAEVVLVNHDKVTTGVLQQNLEEIKYKALPSALVEKVKIDVGEMRVGDTVKVEDLDIAKDKDVELITPRDAVVVTVTAVHLSKADEAVLEADEAKAEEKEAKEK